MTRRPVEDGQSQAKTASMILVLGLDDNGKSKGARFGAEQKQQASLAAESLKLQVYEANTDQLRDIAKKLPTGRIYAKGRAFVPFIKRGLYDQVIAATNGQVDASPERTATETALPDIGSPFPSNWDEIAPGHVVLAPEGPKDGWWEAVVLSRDSRTLTLRYRDYPKMPKRVLDIYEVALVHPGPE